MTTLASGIKRLAVFALAAASMPLVAYAAGEAVHIERQPWSFAGFFGRFDQNQLQRGFQVYKDACAQCHGVSRLAFRNRAQAGGPFGVGTWWGASGMSDGNLVDVVDREGWHKEYPLAKAIVSIGSDPRNDVVLERTRGGGVSPRHLQLISATDGPGYRLINMGDTDVQVGQGQSLAPRAFVEIGPNETVRVASPCARLPTIWNALPDVTRASSAALVEATVTRPSTWVSP